MVMDFEDGVSLSRMLKDGRRFNQASLGAMIRPIAEGLERAHRVGVLHRDIKPANILVSPEGRPVLIDFGSARFESGEATSTTVTFHTPPYAPIEQYVKTYEQGPWTDVYALGVVLYECIAGEKPAEVLERMHSDADKPLLEGDWPGFSQTFLAAVDAAMTIRPDERPRSVSEWLAMFDEEPGAGPVAPVPEGISDDEATKIGEFVDTPQDIKPVAPLAPGFETNADVRTPVPERPSQAKFKRAGEDTSSKSKKSAGTVENVAKSNEDKAVNASATDAPPVKGKSDTSKSSQPNSTKSEPDPKPQPQAKPESDSKPKPEPEPEAKSEPEPEAKPKPEAKSEPKQKQKPEVALAAAKSASDVKSGAQTSTAQVSKNPVVLAGGAVAAAALLAGGWFAFGGSSNEKDPDTQSAEVSTLAGSDGVIDGLAEIAVDETKISPVLFTLASEAKKARVPAGATAELSAAGEKLASMESEVAKLPPEAASRKAKVADMTALANTAMAGFIKTVAADGQAQSRKIARDVPWADPAKTATVGLDGKQKRIAASLRRARTSLRAAEAGLADASKPGELAALARQSIASFKTFAVAVWQARNIGPAKGAQSPTELVREDPAVDSQAQQAAVSSASVPVAQTESAGGVSAATRKQFDTLVSTGMGTAKQIISLGDKARPGASASKAEKDGYRTRQQNEKSAREYLQYLDTLSRSMVATKTEKEARKSVSKASQTLSYLSTLLASSKASMP